MFIFNSLILYIILVCLISLILILLNYLISPHNNNVDKTGPFECGFSSFRQSRITYNVAFILIAILFLPFDIELTTILPYTLSIYNTNAYGLSLLVYFLIALLIGFIMEINTGALYLKRIFIRPNVNSGPGITYYNKNNHKVLYNYIYN